MDRCVNVDEWVLFGQSFYLTYQKIIIPNYERVNPFTTHVLRLINVIC